MFRRLKIRSFLNEQIHIAPLVVFRVIFGGVMLGGIIRFWLNGWIYEQYIKPTYHFTYYGFEWVKPLGSNGMCLIFFLMGLTALFVMIGFLYRISTLLFFLTFTYVELIDKTNYLNHYYFISIVAFLMILMPAGRYFSMDTQLRLTKKITHIPRFFITTFQLQLGIVYFFAGVAKLNYDWLFEAMPLRIWLQPHSDMSIIGYFMDKVWVAYFFSWFGALYDLSIPFLLAIKKTRPFAFFFVIIFHVLTKILFQIGMFPYIMILATLIFFSENFHKTIINKLKQILAKFTRIEKTDSYRAHEFKLFFKPLLITFLILHFTVQVLLPFRYVLYPGKLFWTEQGFRFSWRVMLMEKGGKVFFHVTDNDTGKSGEVMIDNELTVVQEKMMSTQPDMILEYAHHLKEKYIKQGIKNPKITAECYVTLNGEGSRLFIDKNVDLTQIKESYAHKWWILPYSQNE